MTQSKEIAFDVSEVERVLLPHHLKTLREESGINDAVIAARGYRSISSPDELVAYGFKPYQTYMVSKETPAILMPVHALDGTVPYFNLRPDAPRTKEKKKRDGASKAVVIKYETPAGVSLRADCNPLCREKLRDPNIRIILTEGQKKGDSAVSCGEIAIALPGVWGFKSKNEYGGIEFSTDFDYVPFNNGRLVIIAFDNDILENRSVKGACDRLALHAKRKGANVKVAYIPGSQNGKKIGLDDYLKDGNTIEDLEKLADAPSVSRDPAPPKIELLTLPPRSINKPLLLVDGRAYATTWIYTKIECAETKEKDGTIRKHDPPLTNIERYRFIVREDGLVFTSIGHGYGYSDRIRPLSELGFEVNLLEIPRADRLWSQKGVAVYIGGYRPDPVRVFSQITDVIDRFVDFAQSLAGQRVMSMLIACYVLATWLIDAFTVIGFLWPNGDKGSGKTKLLVLISELGYLGELMGSGGSYASLRDLADYGAVMCFDDAEGFADPKKCDADKRNLFLAGNRKGSVIPVKEPTGNRDRPWTTRYVNTFCPRIFSAICLPDPTLETRTIIIPLIRSDDKAKANADALEYDLWPHDRRELIDNLWVVGLTYLAELPRHERRVNERSSMIGRDLEPWRAVLAVASWLEDKGANGLYSQMEAIALNYQSERQNLRSDDITTLVIRALCEIAVQDSHQGHRGEWSIETQRVTDTVLRIADEMDSPIKRESITPVRIGLALNRMRFKSEPRSGGKGGRRRLINYRDLQRWTTTYGIDLSSYETQDGIKLSKLKSQDQPGAPGSIGTPGSSDTQRQGPVEPGVPREPSSKTEPDIATVTCYNGDCGQAVVLIDGKGHCKGCGIDLLVPDADRMATL